MGKGEWTMMIRELKDTTQEEFKEDVIRAAKELFEGRPLEEALEFIYEMAHNRGVYDQRNRDYQG
jgi:hypothetical protein